MWISRVMQTTFSGWVGEEPAIGSSGKKALQATCRVSFAGLRLDDVNLFVCVRQLALCPVSRKHRSANGGVWCNSARVGILAKVS